LLARLATVRMRLVDGRSGAPVTKARPSLNDSQTGGGGNEVDADGRVTMTGLQPGLLALEVWASGLSAPPIQLEVRAGAQLDLGDIVMQPADKVTIVLEGFGDSISLTLRWLEATPLPDCQTKPLRYGGRSGENELSLYPGRYLVSARDQDGLVQAEIDTRAVVAAGQPVRFAVQPGPKLTLKNQVGDTFLDMKLRNAQGRVIWSQLLSGHWEQTWPMKTGDYTAELTDLEGKVTTKVIHLGNAGATLVLP
ncbi:MAG TPA: hypothetical protein VK348_12450, partial [Planctomycetota bacterium]|nr:hypothetical protein [Planctomycetota bacterium]